MKIPFSTEEVVRLLVVEAISAGRVTYKYKPLIKGAEYKVNAKVHQDSIGDVLDMISLEILEIKRVK